MACKELEIVEIEMHKTWYLIYKLWYMYAVMGFHKRDRIMTHENKFYVYFMFNKNRKFNRLCEC